MTMRCKSLRFAFPLLLIALFLIGTAPARADSYDIHAVANPSRLTYGADNNVTITVTVRATNGSLAPDGTTVYFYTTLGSLPAMAYTKQGQVSVLLENTTGAGQAIVTVNVGSSRETLTVEYLGQGGVPVTKTKRISYRLKARQVYFGVDRKVFDLREDAVFIAPTFTVKADAIQFDVDGEHLCAQNNITITAGAATLTADKLNLSLSTLSGFLVTITPEITFKDISIPSLEVKDDDAARATDFLPLSPEPTRTWIVCREATVFPHQQIQFRWPKFYLNNFDHLLLILPNHVMDLQSYNAGTFFNSQISLASDAGLNVDFPIYYAADSNYLGSLHIREVSKGSSFYRGVEGPQLSLEQEYLVGAKGDGALYLDDLSRPTRSMSWEHSQDFGHTRINLNGSYDRYSADTPYTSRFGLSISQDVGKTNLYLTSNWSAFDGNQDAVAELNAYLPPFPLGHTHFRLTCDPFLGTTSTVIAATAATDTQPKQQADLVYQGVRMGLSMPTWNLLGGTLAPTLNDEFSHGNDGLLTNFLDAGVSYRKQLNRMFSTTLSYAYSLSQTNSVENAGTGPSQRVSVELLGRSSQRWDLNAYTSYSIDDSTFYGNASATYYLPWGRTHNGNHRWSLQYAASVISGQNAISTADHLFSMGWDIGAYTLVVHYSPTGNNAVTGIGSGTGKHWAVELVRQGW